MAGGQEAKKHLHTHHNNSEPLFRLNLYNPSYMKIPDKCLSYIRSLQMVFLCYGPPIVTSYSQTHFELNSLYESCYK